MYPEMTEMNFKDIEEKVETALRNTDHNRIREEIERTVGL